MNYESPYTIWWDENIQGKYGVGFEIRQLMAMAFEGGRKSRDAEIEELKTIRGNSVLVPSDKLQAMQAEIEALKKELALQRLPDIGQSIERELTDEEIIDLCVKQVEKLIVPTEPDYNPSQWNDAIERAILKILNVKAILKQYRELKKAIEK
jgi:hypothetical protein